MDDSFFFSFFFFFLYKSSQVASGVKWQVVSSGKWCQVAGVKWQVSSCGTDLDTRDVQTLRQDAARIDKGLRKLDTLAWGAHIIIAHVGFDAGIAWENLCQTSVEYV
jgi:hypothetical protein